MFPEGTVFFTIQAIDNDYGVDSDLEYNLTSSLTDTFELRDSVDCEGCQDVVNTKIIDREQLGDESVYYIDIVDNVYLGNYEYFILNEYLLKF